MPRPDEGRVAVAAPPKEVVVGEAITVRDLASLMQRSPIDLIKILMQYGIMGIPTLMLFKNGEVAERIVGFMPMPALEPKIARHLD